LVRAVCYEVQNGARYERANGAVRLEFSAASGTQTVLTDLYQRAPCRALFPEPENDDLVQAVLLTTSGGLTGGDTTDVDIEVRAGARVTVTTQAAEKLYRSVAPDSVARVEIAMRVETGALAEWLAQETILFNGSRLRRRLHADVSTGARLLAVESIVLGRTAMGERFDTGFLHDAWRIRRRGRLLWADALHIPTDVRALRTARFGFGTAVACSTIVYVGDDAARQLVTVRQLLDENRILQSHRGSVTAAATAFDGLLLVRLLADDCGELRSAVVELIRGIRELVYGLPARLPRVWHC
jgi:urease accessory protein